MRNSAAAFEGLKSQNLDWLEPYILLHLQNCRSQKFRKDDSKDNRHSYKMNVEVELQEDEEEEDIIARQNEFIARLENTFNMWETSCNLDKMSLGGPKLETSQPPQFHEFGMPSEPRCDTVEDINMESLRLDERAPSMLPKIVVSGPERGIPEGAAASGGGAATFFERLSHGCEDFRIGNNMIGKGQDNTEATEALLGRLRLAQDGVLAEAASRVAAPRHPERCALCGLDRSLRTHRARCTRRRGIHFACPSCRAPFSRRPELMAHMKRVGQGAKMGRVCPSCSLCR